MTGFIYKNHQRVLGARGIAMIGLLAGIANAQSSVPPPEPRAELAAEPMDPVVDAAAPRAAASAEPSTGEALVAERREWLRNQFTAEVTSVRQLATINQRLDEMPAEEVHRRFLQQQQKVNRQAQANQIAANRADLVAQRLAAGQMLAAPGFPIWPRQPAIAYAPVVQWFPTGTQLSVDPYGGIGFSTSQYLGAGYYGVPFHGANCPCRLCRGRIRFGQPNVTPPPEREIYYDGLRTRVEPWSDGGRRSRP